MLNILIVDDDQNKVEKVKDAIDSMILCDEYEVDTAICVSEGFQNLKNKKYDLLILDINIPIRKDSPPKKNGGVSLLNNIERTSSICRPSHIVGLTAYDDVKDLYGETFNSKLWHLIKYDPSSTEWSDGLSEKISHILECNKRHINKIKILFLGADPTNASTDRLLLDCEVKEIEGKIRQSEFRDSLEFVTRWAVTIDEIILAFNEVKPNVVHFSGHGNASGELIVLDENGKAVSMPIKGVKALFDVMKEDVKLVFLNSCYSAKQAKAISRVIDCCIGMKDPVSDDSAIIFSATFYRAIGFGKSVKKAYDQGILALTLNQMADKDNPVLMCNYKNPDEITLIS